MRSELTIEGITCIVSDHNDYWLKSAFIRWNESETKQMHMIVDQKTLTPTDLSRGGTDRISRRRHLDITKPANKKIIDAKMADILGFGLIPKTIALNVRRVEQKKAREDLDQKLDRRRTAGPLLYEVLHDITKADRCNIDAATWVRAVAALNAAESGPVVQTKLLSHAYRHESHGIYGERGTYDINYGLTGEPELRVPCVIYFRQEDDPFYVAPHPYRYHEPHTAYRSIVLWMPDDTILSHDLLTGIETRRKKHLEDFTPDRKSVD